MKKRYYIIRVISLIITVTLLLTISFSSAQSLSKIGSQGEEVRQIQLQLKNLGYFNDKIDGIYGKQTKEAVIKFQMDNNLIADGIAGTKTLEKLNITSNSSPNIFTDCSPLTILCPNDPGA